MDYFDLQLLFQSIEGAQNHLCDLVDADLLLEEDVLSFAESLCRKNDVRYWQYIDWLGEGTGSKAEILKYTEADMERLYD